MDLNGHWSGFFDRESAVSFYQYGFANRCLEAGEFSVNLSLTTDVSMLTLWCRLRVQLCKPLFGAVSFYQYGFANRCLEAGEFSVNLSLTTNVSIMLKCGVVLPVRLWKPLFGSRGVFGQSFSNNWCKYVGSVMSFEAGEFSVNLSLTTDVSMLAVWCRFTSATLPTVVWKQGSFPSTLMWVCWQCGDVLPVWLCQPLFGITGVFCQPFSNIWCKYMYNDGLLRQFNNHIL